MPDPTPEEIAAACEKIQAAWTKRERRKRAGEQLWTVPEVREENFEKKLPA